MQFKDGKLKPYLKSEQIPQNQSEPVVKIVARNFIDTIEEGKDVLVMFYTPDCDKCALLAPLLV